MSTFKDRFKAWKEGKSVYKDGLRISFDEGKDEQPQVVEQPVPEPDLYAALDYVRDRKRDVLMQFDSGKDVAGGYHFNAIKQISPNAGLSYGSYYDKLTGDWMMDARRQGLPRFRGGKNSGFPKPSPKKLKRMNYIIQQFRNAGMTDFDIAGIMGNGDVESARTFDPAIISPSGNYSGVWQNNRRLRAAIIKKYGDFSLESQVKYIVDWATSGKSEYELLGDETLNHNRTGFKLGTYKNPIDAMVAFKDDYERSGQQNIKERTIAAKQLYDWIRQNSPGNVVIDDSNTEQVAAPAQRVVSVTPQPTTAPSTPPPTAPQHAGLWDNLKTPRPLLEYDGGKDVDTRSDTTRQGYHEGVIPWGAGLGSAGQGLLSLFDYMQQPLANIGSNNTNLIYGHAPAVGRLAGGAIGRLFGSGIKSLGKAPKLMTPEILQNTYNVKMAVRNGGVKTAKNKLDKYSRDWVEYNKDKVDLSQLTAEDVNKLIKMNMQDLRTHGDQFVMVNRHPFAGDYEFSVMKNGKPIADMQTVRAGNTIIPDMVSSYTNAGGMSRALYDAAIEAGGQLGYNGIRTGDHLISAPKTWRVWQHYPDKLLIGKNGYHQNRMMVSPTEDGAFVKTWQDAQKAAAGNINFTFENGPVYQLRTPSQFVPIKDMGVVDASIVRPNGTFNRSWNTTDMFKVALPTIGLGAGAAQIGLDEDVKFNNGKDFPRYRGGRIGMPENGGVRYNPMYPVPLPLTKNQQYVQGDDGQWVRLTNPGMEAVVSARRPVTESDSQYFERRVKESQPQRTWLSDAADVLSGVGIGADAVSMSMGLPPMYSILKTSNEFSKGNYIQAALWALPAASQLYKPMTQAVTQAYYNSPYRLRQHFNQPDRFYRVVGEDAIQDANRSGLIRTSQNNYDPNRATYFQRGRIDETVPFNRNSYVIEGASTEQPFKVIANNGTGGEYQPGMVYGYAFTPTTKINGSLYNIGNAQNFKYWEPKLGGLVYKRRNFQIPEQPSMSRDFWDTFINGSDKPLSDQSLDMLRQSYANIVNGISKDLSLFPESMGSVMMPTQEMVNEYKNFVLPRLLRSDSSMMEASMKASTDAGRRITQGEKLIDDVLNQGYHEVPNDVMDVVAGKNVLGQAFPEGRGVAVREGAMENAWGHEMRHRQDFLKRISMEDYGKLKKAYGEEFLDYPSDSPIVNERVTTNYDGRRWLLKRANAEKFPLESQNKVIDKMPDDEIFRSVENSNGYGEFYIRELRKKNKLTHELADAIRTAYKEVGIFSSVGYFGLRALKQPLNYTENEL